MMKANDVYGVPELHQLPVLSQDHPVVVAMLAPNHHLEVAEARDMRRVFHLLHRAEYEPVAVVKANEEGEGESVRVYFARLDHTQDEPADDSAHHDRRDPGHVLETAPHHRTLRKKNLQAWLSQLMERHCGAV